MIEAAISSMFFLPGDVNWPPWALFVAIALCLAAAKLPRPFSWLFGFLSIHSVIFAMVKPYNPLEAVEEALQMQATTSIAIICAFSIWQFKDVSKQLGKALIFVGLIGCFYPLLGNSSIQASFTALWVFICLHNKLPYLALLGVGSVAFSQSSISAIALMLGVVFSFNSFWVVRIVAIGIGFLPFLLFDLTNLRFKVWPKLIDFWTKNFDMWIGSGLGSFQIHTFHPEIKSETIRIWPWAHSDWLEIWLETGWIGLALSLICFFWILKKCENQILLGGVICGGVLMIGNYPLQVATCALAMFYLGVEAWTTKEP